MPDLTHDEMNRRIAEFDGWTYVEATRGHISHWVAPGRSFQVRNFDYCSDKSPRSLLAGVEHKLARLNLAPDYRSKLSDLAPDGYVVGWWYAIAPAEARCRAICAVLDEMEAGNAN